MAGFPADRRATWFAILAGFVTVAFQLAGKATRDALFLSTFSVAALPRMLIVSAVVSAFLTILLTRIMARTGPGRLIPRLFLISGALLLGEWGLTANSRQLAAVLVYLHFAALGALLVSGFWAMVNERFDPRSARGAIRQITTGASLGGLLGGLLSERIGATFSVPAMLPVLAGLHLAAAWLVLGVGQERDEPGSVAPVDPTPAVSARAAFAGSRYLVGLALLMVLTSAAEGILDYVFKARAAVALVDGASLLRFFAAFYTGTALLTILIQLLLLRPLLARIGIGRSAALLPAGVSVGALGSLFLPGLGSLLFARGLEVVLRGSLFRAAWEMLFTPVSPAEKRATKLLVDVGAARVGDVTGAAIVQVALVLGVVSLAPLLGAIILLSLAGMLVARQLNRGYSRALRRSLERRVRQLPTGPEDAGALLQTFGALDLATLRMTLPETASGDGVTRSDPALPSPRPPAEAAPLTRLEGLTSGHAAVVRLSLAEAELPAELVEPAIDLLPWDEVALDAIRALRQVVPRETTRLVAHLLDQDEDFAIRRRLVLVLVESRSQAGFDGLLGALEDVRFEVRYRAGRALSSMVSHLPQLRVAREQILAVVLREVAVERGVWESRQLLDESGDDWSPMEAEVLRDRATRSLEHVFTLLSLILPRETLRLAFHGLHTGDRHLRGTALEYLEAVLPDAVRERLWPFLETELRSSGPRRSADVAVQDLLASRESILLALAAVREKAGEGTVAKDGPV